MGSDQGRGEGREAVRLMTTVRSGPSGHDPVNVRTSLRATCDSEPPERPEELTLSYQPPLPPGPGPGGPHAYYGQPTQGAPPPYGVHPAYAGMPSPPQSSGLNPWIAGLIGVFIGGFMAVVASMLIPMIFFGFLMGGPFGDEGFMETPDRVAVAPDGSVSGVALAEVLEKSEWYEGMTCPNTAKVGTDVTTICEGSDGFEGMRVVVVFRGTDGRFAAADLYE